MANIKFTQLPNQSTVTDTTIVPTVDSGTNYTVTGANLKTYVNSTTGNVTAGNLLTTGQVSAQGNITTLAQISAQGNITGSYIFGNGSQLTGLPATYGNADVSNYLASGTDLGNIVSQGNISGAYIIANGSALTNLNIGPAISVYTGNIAGGNISATGNIVGTYITGNISGAVGGYGNSNVQSVLQTYSGSFTAGSISTTGNITAPYFVGNGAALTGVTASLGGTMTSNIAGAGYSITGIGQLSATGNITGANITGNLFGSGTNLTGIPTSINAGAGISVSASTGAVTITNNNPTPYTNANVAAYLPTYTGNLAGGNLAVTTAITAGTLTGTHFGNGAGLANIVTSITAGTGISVNAATGAVTITATGGSGGNAITNGTSNVSIAASNGPVRIYANAGTGAQAYFDDGVASGGNINLTPGGSGTINLNLVKVQGGVLTAGTLSATANIVGGNISTTNFSATTILGGTGGIQSAGAISGSAPYNQPQATKTGTATGVTGTICWDANYIYVCTATNVWKRVALSAF